MRLLVVCIVVAVALPAVAQPAPAPEALEDARQEYQRGADLYARGRYDEARVAFESAYARSKLPTLLPNIADCQERLGQEAAAAETLRAYLATPNVPDRDQVQARLAALEERFKPTGAAAAPPPPAPSSKVPTLRRAVVGSGVATGVLAVTAGVLSIVAASRYHDLAEDCRAGGAGCTSARADSLHRLDLAADVTWGLTAAAAVTTLTVHLILRHEKKKLHAELATAH